MSILVTGGAGFIGSNFIIEWLKGSVTSLEPIINIDSLTYAGNAESLNGLKEYSNYTFAKGDICDAEFVSAIIMEYKPRAIVHFAAESHVDRSIKSPQAFIKTNVLGTYVLLEAARSFWQCLNASEKALFRFHHVSTDEVYGSLEKDSPAFSEESPYAPNSPYSASKAASDHFVRAWYRTYGLPVLTTNCSNNYGPYQFPEKLIPLVISNALAGEPLPIFGDGSHIRDWIFVADHCSAIRSVLKNGVPGETYVVGGGSEKTNREIVENVCSLLDELSPDPRGSYNRLITKVDDRLGHDYRYAINFDKLKSDLGWYPTETLNSGLRKTVEWYLSNSEWLRTSKS